MSDSNETKLRAELEALAYRAASIYKHGTGGAGHVCTFDGDSLQKFICGIVATFKEFAPSAPSIGTSGDQAPSDSDVCALAKKIADEHTEWSVADDGVQFTGEEVLEFARTLLARWGAPQPAAPVAGGSLQAAYHSMEAAHAALAAASPAGQQPVAIRYRFHFPDGEEVHRTGDWKYAGPWDALPSTARDVQTLYSGPAAATDVEAIGAPVVACSATTREGATP